MGVKEKYESILILAYNYDRRPSEKLKNDIEEKFIELHQILRSKKHISFTDSFWDSNVYIVLILELLNKNNILETDIHDFFVEFDERLIHEILYGEAGSISDYIYYLYLYLLRAERIDQDVNFHSILIIQAVERIMEQLENTRFNLYKHDITGAVYILHFISSLGHFTDYIEKIIKTILQKIEKKSFQIKQPNEIALNNLFIAHKISTINNWNYNINWHDEVRDFLPKWTLNLDHNSMPFCRLYFLNTLFHITDDKVVVSFFEKLENEINLRKLENQNHSGLFSFRGINFFIETYKKKVSDSWTELLLFPKII